MSTRGSGLAVALKAQNSDGIADYWKFFPQSDGELADNAGNAYVLLEVSGIGFGRDQNDYAILGPDEDRLATLTFSGDGRVGSSFNLSFGIWLWDRTDANEKQRGIFRISLTDIRPRRS